MNLISLYRFLAASKPNLVLIILKTCFAWPALLILLASLPVLSQNTETNRLIRKANRFFKNENYLQAVKLYLKADSLSLASGSSIAYNIGMCYALSTQQRYLAIPYLERARASGSNLPADYEYYLARAYQQAGKYDKALKFFKSFREKTQLDPEDDRLLRKKILESYNAILYTSDTSSAPKTTPITVLNTENDEYSPLTTADGSLIYYTRSSSQGSSQTRQNERIGSAQMFEGKWQNLSSVSLPTTNGVLGQSPLSLSPDGQKMLVYLAGKSKNSLQMFQLGASGWLPLDSWLPPSLNEAFNQSSASISADEKHIYFSSNRIGGYGGQDIWHISKDSTGKWQKPQNLGPIVNTESDEESPFLHPDGKTLYFSSNGASSMGGYDIFKTTRLGEYDWTMPNNLGYPINSADDDLYMSVLADGKKGYYSSNKKGSKGGQDLYITALPDKDINIPLTMVKGRILAGDSLKPVSTKILVIDKSTGKTLERVYNPNTKTGKYLIIFPPGKNYEMIVQAKGYKNHLINIYIPNQSYFYELYQEIVLHPVYEKNKMVGESIVVRNAFYDNKTTATPEELYANLDAATNTSQAADGANNDLYELMTQIIANQDSIGYEKLLEQMYGSNTKEVKIFETMAAAPVTATYMYGKNDKNQSEGKIINGQKIETLPALATSNTPLFEPKGSPVLQSAGLEQIQTVYFKNQEYLPDGNVIRTLFKIINAAKTNDSLFVIISGHTDSNGSEDFNLELSQGRSSQIANWIHACGIKLSRIYIQNYGESKLAIPQEPTAWQNRRVEIIVTTQKPK